MLGRMERTVRVPPWVGALGLLVPLSASAAPPLRHWQTFSVRCCDVTYQDGTYEVARRYAAAAQEAYDGLVILLGYTPAERTQILVTDDTDSSNGSATPLPFNTIRAFARPPASQSELGDYDDWARALLLHEMVHIIHTDTQRGIPALANWLVGKWWPPNVLMPRWYIEGLAVMAETRLTTAGRAQSSLFDMYLRTAALEGRLWELDVLSSGGRTFPAGNGAYLYGGHFLSWLAQRYGDGVWADIHRRNGGAVMPYALDWAAEEAFHGRTWASLYDEWRTELTREAVALRDRVEKAGRTVERRLTALGNSVFWPRALNDGRVVFYASPVDDTAGLYVMEPVAGGVPRVRRLNEVQGVQGLSPTPDGRSVIFSQPELYAGDYAFLDLFRADLRDGTITRLTAGARLRDPDVHPDGRVAMAVENRPADSRLVLVDLQTGHVTGLFSFPDAAEIHSPRFSPRGDAVVFTAWRAGGFRDVYLLRAGATEPIRLTADRAMDGHPAFTQDGEAVVFSSDRGGVYNIYQHDLRTGVETQLTNVVTGALMPLPMERQGALMFVGYGMDAYDLHAAPWAPFPATPPVPGGAGRPLPLVGATAPEPYNPLPSMMPRAFVPQLRFSSVLGLMVGARLSGADLLGYHSYESTAQVWVPSGDYTWLLAYFFTGLPWALGVSATGYVSRAGLVAVGDGIRAPYVEDVLRMDASLTIPLQLWRQGHTFVLSYAQELRRPRLTLNQDPTEAFTSLRPQGPLGFLQLAYTYNTGRVFRDSVATEWGRRISARVRVSHPALISSSTFMDASGEYREYIPVPGLARHVWVLSLAGGISRGDPYRRRLYFLGGWPGFTALSSVGVGQLRGYPFASLRGDGFLLQSTEWRFPILEIQQGLYALPVFVDRLRGLVFLDQAVVFGTTPQGAQLRRGLGAEAMLATDWFYFIPLLWRAGVARGLDADGEDLQLYLSVGLEG